MKIVTNANLKPCHTFSIDSTCDVLVEVESQAELIAVYQRHEWLHLPKLLIGKGSNLLFTAHYSGVVIVNKIMGIEVSESASDWLLHVNGGQDWPELVSWSLEQGYAGLENLALIPGCAGSAPIQNIGAYGVEFKDVCDYVDVILLDSLESRRLSYMECEFGYRDSIFKRSLYGKALIVAVGLRLAKQWIAEVSYGGLKSIPANELSAQRVYEQVCSTRMMKLPNPEVMGNAGSFFKNPVISRQKYQALLAEFPDLVAYPAGDNMKVAAGWLIEHSGLKGVAVGGAMVHTEQALVIVNSAGATASDVVNLARKVCQKVAQIYQINLQPEVRFMVSDKEVAFADLPRDLKL